MGSSAGLTMSVDGGRMDSVAATPLFDSDYTFTLSSPTLLYSTGNLFHNYFSGYDANIDLLSGSYRGFYRASRNTIEDTALTGALSFQLLESPNYKIYDRVNHIFYPTTGATISYSGIDGNGNVAVSPLFVPSVTTTTIWTTNENENSAIVPSQNVLLVYNTSLQESIDIKNYYTGMRTGLTGVNILGISCSHYSGVYSDTGNYVNNIRRPIHRYLMTGNKPIKYVVLLHGIPTLITGGLTYVNVDHLEFSATSGNAIKMNSVSISYDLSTSLFQFSGYARNPAYSSEYPRMKYMQRNVSPAPELNRPFTFAEFSGNTALFCHVATIQGRTNELSGYINKICTMGIPSGIYLLGSGQNTTFTTYSDNASFLTSYIHQPMSFYSELGVKFFNSKARSVAPYMSGINVGGFNSDGFHGDLYLDGTGTVSLGNVAGQWETNSNSCRLTGYNWFIASNYESFGGDMLEAERTASHSPFSRQIKPQAFGGSNYSNIPVGFVGSQLEPYYGGIEYNHYFDAWFMGRPFIECAYIGLNNIHYAIFGDPFTKWR